MTKFVQVWKLMWGTEADIRSWSADDKATYMTADRLNANLAAAYDRGVKDAGKPGSDAQRAGIEAFGADIRKSLTTYRTGPMIPAWVIEHALSEWNVPE